MARLDPNSLKKLEINFEIADSPDPACTELGTMLHLKFTDPDPRYPGYGKYEVGASIATLPDSYDQWFENVGYYTRRKLRKAAKLGYKFSPIERQQYVDDIFEINTSMPERQGREMTEGYRVKPTYERSPDYTCARHRINYYGVLFDGKLVAYTWVYQVGQMCLFSTILGHGDHLKNGVMFLLIAGTLEDLIPSAHTKYAMYNMHWSGTDGLRFFKEQMGFEGALVAWKRGDEPPPTVWERLREKAAGPRAAIARARVTTRKKVKRARVRLGRIKRRVLKRAS